MLFDMHKEQRSKELYEMGMAVALAFNEPKRLKELIGPVEIDVEALPAMLRIPKKKDVA